MSNIFHKLFKSQSLVNRAIALIIISTIFLSIMQGMMRYVSEEMHPFQAVFFRNLFGLIILLPFILRRGLKPLRTKRLPLHTVRGLLHVTSMLCFFYGLAITPLAKVAALSFTAPLFATFAAVLILHERLGISRALALFIGLLGALIIVRPGLESLSMGSILVLISQMIWGFALIIIKRLGETESSLTITLYMMLYLTPLSLIPAAMVWDQPTINQIYWLFFVGCCGTLGHFCVAQALKDADAAALMPFDFGRLIWASLIGFLFFSEIPDIWTLTGAVVIFTTAMYVSIQESRGSPIVLPKEKKQGL